MHKCRQKRQGDPWQRMSTAEKEWWGAAEGRPLAFLFCCAHPLPGVPLTFLFAFVHGLVGQPLTCSNTVLIEIARAFITRGQIGPRAVLAQVEGLHPRNLAQVEGVHLAQVEGVDKANRKLWLAQVDSWDVTFDLSQGVNA